MRPGRRRGIAAGTVIALTAMVLTLGGSLWMLFRLSGGNIDIAKTSRSILKIGSTVVSRDEEDILIAAPEGAAASPQPANGEAARAEKEPKSTETPKEGRFTLTVGGTLAVEENVRKSCYSTDSKKYDFSDVASLLAEDTAADISAVFLENLLDDSGKITKTVIPENAADLLRSAGFNMAFCGFARVFDREAAGIAATRVALQKREITPLGALGEESDSAWQTLEVNGIRVALAQYTATVPSQTRKNMAKKGISGLVPEAEADRITEDIRQARAEGAAAVIVFLNWGKDGTKSPDKNQIALARKIADAGADLIVGNGSRIAHKAEWLEASDGSGRQTLCVYSLGTLLSDNRTRMNRMAGILLHVTFVRDGNSGVRLEDAGYTPLYTWRYKQDGKYYYRCLNASRPAPDGMESEQIQAMEKANSLLETLLEGSPLRLW